MKTISNITYNGDNYSIKDTDADNRLVHLEAFINKWEERILCEYVLEPDYIMDQNHSYTLTAKELENWTFPDYSYFVYKSNYTTLYSRYGWDLKGNGITIYTTGCWDGKYITDDEDEIITIWCGNYLEDGN